MIADLNVEIGANQSLLIHQSKTHMKNQHTTNIIASNCHKDAIAKAANNELTAASIINGSIGSDHDVKPVRQIAIHLQMRK